MFGLPNTSQVADVMAKGPISTGCLSILEQNTSDPERETQVPGTNNYDSETTQRLEDTTAR